METKFNFNSAICTDVSQSRRLLALGLKKDTADMHHWESEGKIYTYVGQMGDPNGIPAWSLHRLIVLLPVYIVVPSSSGLNPNFYLTIRDGIVSYKDSRGFTYGSTSGNMYDAIMRMMAFLIKEGYFNKEYLV